MSTSYASSKWLIAFKQDHALASGKKRLKILRFKSRTEADVPLGTLTRYCLHQTQTSRLWPSTFYVLGWLGVISKVSQILNTEETYQKKVICSFQLSQNGWTFGKFSKGWGGGGSGHSFIKTLYCKFSFLLRRYLTMKRCQKLICFWKAGLP